MGGLGWQEVMIILVVAAALLGPRRLPEFGRQIGRAMREFRRVTSEVRRELQQELGVESDNSSARPGDRSLRQGTSGPVKRPPAQEGSGVDRPVAS
ncbi:MAG: Sec-independent protein translocase subunit TatA/TatB [Actinomycetota bacterium]